MSCALAAVAALLVALAGVAHSQEASLEVTGSLTSSSGYQNGNARESGATQLEGATNGGTRKRRDGADSSQQQQQRQPELAVSVSPPAPTPNGMSCFACSTLQNKECKLLGPRLVAEKRAVALVQARLARIGQPAAQANNASNAGAGCGNATLEDLGSTSTVLKELGIELRECVDDQHFCTTVSIGRLEYVDGAPVTHFWALERNCTKSCNNGCMLVGDRIRLRVCSQCCQTSGCNIGSGAGAPLKPPLPARHLAAAVLLLAGVAGRLLLGGAVSARR